MSAPERWAQLHAQRLGLPRDDRVFMMYDKLICAALNVPNSPIVRRPSMAHDGTPLTLSTSITENTDSHLLLRLLVEPGGQAISVSKQLELTLSLMDDLFSDCCWSVASRQLTSICQAVLPADRDTANDWWGGAWLGLTVHPTGSFQLRLYLNMRWGSLQDRWQRVMDAICLFADSALTPALTELVKCSEKGAVPVGLGLAFSRGELVAMRLYVGVEDPAQYCFSSFLHSDMFFMRDEVVHYCKSVCDYLGELPRQSLTIGYDFVLQSGIVDAGIARCKFDVSCQWIGRDDRVTIKQFSCDLAHSYGLASNSLSKFYDDIDNCFGGGLIEFLSLSVLSQSLGMSAYCKPDGYSIYKGY